MRIPPSAGPGRKSIYTREDLKWDKFIKPKEYIIMEPDVTNVKPFIRIKLCGIFLFSPSDLFMSSNDLENKKTETNKQEDKIIELYI
jgi:hypothetical protein